MFTARNNLGLSEYAVSRALLELNCQEEYIPIRSVANHIGCSIRTVERALKRLMEAEVVVRIDGNNRLGGHRYHVRY